MSTPPPPTVLARFRGCLLGLAAGDALGTTLEFKTPGSFTPIQDMLGGGPFALQPGQWTDDTSMALCLAESLLEKGGFDPVDQMERYCAWAEHGHLSSNGVCFDIGNTVSQALRRYRQGGQPYSGSSDAYSAGNGSLMRLAPVAMYFWRDPLQAEAQAAASSRTTHAAAEAVDACRYYAVLLAGALGGAAKEELLAPLYHPQPGHWITPSHSLAPKVEAVALGSYQRLSPPAIAGTGYVVKALEAALWAFYHSHDFAEGCLLAANLGNDADTTAAIYGQLAGAYYGEEGIPQRWRDLLTRRELIVDFAERLQQGPK
jgi:ADP-ribosyl-[dinitrogen reductase] hydrolase